MAIWERLGWLSEDQGLGTMSTERFRWERGSVRVLGLCVLGMDSLQQASGRWCLSGMGRGGMHEVTKVKLKMFALPS